MKKTNEEPNFNLHLKIDDTLVSLIEAYHDKHTATEIIDFFYGLMNQLVELDGNVVNKRRRAVKVNRTYDKRYQKWKTENNIPIPGEPTYDAYAYRGFYPGTKIPFKMSGVRNGENTGYACFVVIIGDKDRHTSYNHRQLHRVQEAVAEAILLDIEVPEMIKVKSFRTMTPKGMEKLDKQDV